jgi:hypothetical protein
MERRPRDAIPRKELAHVAEFTPVYLQLSDGKRTSHAGHRRISRATSAAGQKHRSCDATSDQGQSFTTLAENP